MEPKAANDHDDVAAQAVRSVLLEIRCSAPIARTGSDLAFEVQTQDLTPSPY